MGGTFQLKTFFTINRIKTMMVKTMLPTITNSMGSKFYALTPQTQE